MASNIFKSSGFPLSLPSMRVSEWQAAMAVSRRPFGNVNGSPIGWLKLAGCDWLAKKNVIILISYIFSDSKTDALLIFNFWKKSMYINFRIFPTKLFLKKVIHLQFFGIVCISILKFFPTKLFYSSPIFRKVCISILKFFLQFFSKLFFSRKIEWEMAIWIWSVQMD